MADTTFGAAAASTAHHRLTRRSDADRDRTYLPFQFSSTCHTTRTAHESTMEAPVTSPAPCSCNLPPSASYVVACEWSSAVCSFCIRRVALDALHHICWHRLPDSCFMATTWFVVLLLCSRPQECSLSGPYAFASSSQSSARTFEYDSDSARLT